MVTPSPSAKHPRAAKPEPRAGGRFSPLIVDTGGVQLLHMQPVVRESNAESPAPETGYELVYELESPGGGPTRLFLAMHKQSEGTQAKVKAKKSSAFDRKRALAQGLPQPVGNESNDELLRSLIEETLSSFKAVQVRHGGHAGSLSVDEVLREVGETLRDKATQPASSPQEGWQALLERGLRSKAALLSSSQFKSTAQASELLGVGEPAVRRRIRERKLFALKSPGDGEHRIPAWALDPEISGAATVALYANAAGMDEWWLYDFLATPNGSLNGLRPFECLLSRANLSPFQRSARQELAESLALDGKTDLLAAVQDILSLEAREGQPA